MVTFCSIAGGGTTLTQLSGGSETKLVVGFTGLIASTNYTVETVPSVGILGTSFLGSSPPAFFTTTYPRTTADRTIQFNLKTSAGVTVNSINLSWKQFQGWSTISLVGSITGDTNAISATFNNIVNDTYTFTISSVENETSSILFSPPFTLDTDVWPVTSTTLTVSSDISLNSPASLSGGNYLLMAANSDSKTVIAIPIVWTPEFGAQQVTFFDTLYVNTLAYGNTLIIDGGVP